MKKSKFQILNTFIIKIIAVFLMTIDHIGLFLISYSGKSIGMKDFFTTPMSLSGYVLRCIGRLALPLFAMLFAEAMKHTKSREKYMSKLGLMCVLILISEIVTTYAFKHSFGPNIFLTLLCSAAFIYFIESKDNKKYLCIIPALYIILSFISRVFLIVREDPLIPLWLMADYDLYGFILCVGFYMIYRLSDARVIELTKEHNEYRSIEELRTYPYYRSFTNIMWALLVIVMNIFFYLITYISSNLDFYNIDMQSYAIFAFIPLLMYNGEKGYKSKKIQASFYIYYPLHLLLLFIIFFSIYRY